MALRTYLKQGTQYPWNKKIPVTVFVNGVNAEKIYVNWQENAGVSVKPKICIHKNTKENKMYKCKFYIKPLSAGYINISANVIASTPYGQEVSAVYFTATAKRDLVLKKPGPFYTLYFLGEIIVIISIITILLIFAKILFMKYMNSLKKQIKKDIES